MEQDGVDGRLRDVLGRIADAEREAGRAPGAVTLVAVSKTHPAEAVLTAVAAGQRTFGENRVQEAAAKFASVRPGRPALRLHLIGPLQTNKARDAVRIADVIETLDRPRLLRAVAEAVQVEGRCPDLLIQVNVGEEPQKAGVAPQAAAAFVAACRAELGERVRGVMAIPPLGVDPRPYFRALAGIAMNHGLPVVSMGMSGDFEAAIAEGATHVRVGSAIFGQRTVPPES